MIVYRHMSIDELYELIANGIVSKERKDIDILEWKLTDIDKTSDTPSYYFFGEQIKGIDVYGIEHTYTPFEVARSLPTLEDKYSLCIKLDIDEALLKEAHAEYVIDSIDLKESKSVMLTEYQIEKSYGLDSAKIESIYFFNTLDEEDINNPTDITEFIYDNFSLYDILSRKDLIKEIERRKESTDER